MNEYASDLASEAISGVAGKIEEITGLDPMAALVALAALVIIAVILFTKPIKMAVKLAINTGLGYVALLLVNFLGADFGIAVGVTWLNAIITGVLGVPGVALLVVLRWMGVM